VDQAALAALRGSLLGKPQSEKRQRALLKAPHPLHLPFHSSESFSTLLIV
jgi:hypothetical protein